MGTAPNLGRLSPASATQEKNPALDQLQKKEKAYILATQKETSSCSSDFKKEKLRFSLFKKKNPTAALASKKKL